MSLGQKVKELRLARGWTQGQLATYAQIDRSSISLLESKPRKRPSARVLIAIARALQVEPAVLFAAGGYLPPSAETQGPSIQRPLPQDLLRQLQATMPILVPAAQQQVPAGVSYEADTEYWPYWPGPGELHHSFIALQVSGDCMEPRIREGEWLIVDRTAAPKPGDIVVAMHEGQPLVKELREVNGRAALVALRGQAPLALNEETQVVGVVRMVMHRP